MLAHLHVKVATPQLNSGTDLNCPAEKENAPPSWVNKQRKEASWQCKFHGLFSLFWICSALNEPSLFSVQIYRLCPLAFVRCPSCMTFMYIVDMQENSQHISFVAFFSSFSDTKLAFCLACDEHFCLSVLQISVSALEPKVSEISCELRGWIDKNHFQSWLFGNPA